MVSSLDTSLFFFFFSGFKFVFFIWYCYHVVTKFLAIFVSSGCNGSLTLLTESHGQIARQPADQARMCIWKISVLSYLRIVFYFQQYRLYYNLHSYPNHTGDCNEKNTRIELKNSQTEQPWKSYCQSGMPEPIATNKSTLYVKFIASDRDLQSEFSAQYYTLPFKQSEYMVFFYSL